MSNIIRGKAFVLGDNIDTDQIIPAAHLIYSLTNPEERKLYGKYAMSSVPMPQSGLPFGNIPFVKEGEFTSEYNVIIAGKNFGCGSSREHAPFALREAGIEAVVAPSYARIFYRNSVDGGFVKPVESFDDLSKDIKTGDEVELDLSLNLIRVLPDGPTYLTRDMGDAAEIVNAGGIFEYARKTGMISR